MIRYRNIKNRWLEVSEDKALEIARRLYKLSKDEYKVEVLNKRFEGRKFKEGELKK